MERAPNVRTEFSSSSSPSDFLFFFFFFLIFCKKVSVNQQPLSQVTSQRKRRVSLIALLGSNSKPLPFPTGSQTTRV
jgi:hypothetical protein